jgi:hypothetical protein
LSLVGNEQAKLTATYVNGLAIAIFAVGGLAPLFSNLYAAGPASVSGWAIVLVSSVCFRWQRSPTSLGKTLSQGDARMNSHIWLTLLAPAGGLAIAGFLYFWTTRHAR